jgi:hypothetical protein
LGRASVGSEGERTMPLRRTISRDSPGWGPEELQRVRRVLLARLDPWSYWVAELPNEASGDLAVVGTTGAFVIAVCGLAGRFHVEGDRATVGGRPIRGLKGLRSEARRASGRLANAEVYSDAAPVACLSRAAAGAPIDVHGVRILALADLVSEITRRERVLQPSRARKGAEALGTVLRSELGGLAAPGAEKD